MKNQDQAKANYGLRHVARDLALLALLVLPVSVKADEFAALCADRAALEKVYYSHRLAAQQPFEKTMPSPLIARLTRAELHREAVLRQIYGVVITSAMVETERQRIDATTRAPEVLAEIKAALGHDSVRFARIMVRPILVERILRTRFENDDQLHAAQRQAADQARADLLAGKPVNDLHEVTWQLVSRPMEKQAVLAAPATPTKSSARSGIYANEGTAQIASVLGSGIKETTRKFYFEDLESELQNILRAELKKPGDVSGVIETAGGFVVFVVRKKTAEMLCTASIAFPKRDYQAWLTQQISDYNP